MALDDLLMQIGEMGRYQWLLFFVAAYCSMLCPISLFAHLFMMTSVPHWCDIGAWNTSHCQEYGLAPMACQELQMNMSIPWTEEEGYSQCHMYDVTGRELGDDVPERSLEVVECQNGWVFDETSRSLTARFSLVCGREAWVRVSQTAFFLGGLAGGLLFGTLSDRFGRVRVLFACVVLSGILAVITLFPIDIWVYTGVRFLTALPSMLLYTLPFVFVSEIVGCSKRAFVAFALPLAWSTGFFLITCLAWLIRDWFYIQLCVIGAHVVVLPVFIFGLLPEPPRWLIAKGRLKEAGEILTKVATRNGKKMPTNYQDEILDETKKEEALESAMKVKPADLFKSWTMTLWIAVLVIVWFGHGLTYLGLTFLSSELGFAFYSSFFINAAVEIPAFLLPMILLPRSRIGRKPPFSFFMIASGVGCIVAMFLPELITNLLPMVLLPRSRIGRKPPFSFFMIASGVWCNVAMFLQPGVWKAIAVFFSKFAISLSFVIMDVYSVEVFPTSVRSFGFHLLAIMAQVGCTISPLVILVASLWPPFPLVLCSAFTVVGGVLLLIVLPETRGTVLPDTIEEALALGKSKRRLPTDDYEETSKA